MEGSIKKHTMATKIDPQLLIMERKKNGRGIHSLEYHFMVVNKDSKMGYPANFVCVLPKLVKCGSNNSHFLEIFGKSSLVIARQLLLEASVNQSDRVIKRKIEERLSLLEQETGPKKRLSCWRKAHILEI